MSIEEGVSLLGYELYDNRVVYCCEYIIPERYRMLVNNCMYIPDFIDADDKINSMIYFGAFIL